VLTAVRKAEADIPPQIWVDLKPEEAVAFVTAQHNLRWNWGNGAFMTNKDCAS